MNCIDCGKPVKSGKDATGGVCGACMGWPDAPPLPPKHVGIVPIDGKLLASLLGYSAGNTVNAAKVDEYGVVLLRVEGPELPVVDEGEVIPSVVPPVAWSVKAPPPPEVKVRILDDGLPRNPFYTP